MMLRRLFDLEVVRYGGISAVALLVDAGLLVWMTQATTINYLVAAGCSFIVGGIVAYLLSVRFVFRYRRLQMRTLEAVAFVALGLVGLCVNIVTIGLLVGVGGLAVLAAKIIAAGLTFGVNFLARKLLLFSPGGLRAASRGRTP